MSSSSHWKQRTLLSCMQFPTELQAQGTWQLPRWQKGTQGQPIGGRAGKVHPCHDREAADTQPTLEREVSVVSKHTAIPDYTRYWALVSVPPIMNTIVPSFFLRWGETGPPLWSSGLSSRLQIRRSRFYSRRYQIFWEVVGLQRGSLSLVSTTEELLVLGRKSSGSGL
jgi:hypothetical protein